MYAARWLQASSDRNSSRREALRAETREPGLNSNFLPMITKGCIGNLIRFPPSFRPGEESGLGPRAPRSGTGWVTALALHHDHKGAAPIVTSHQADRSDHREPCAPKEGHEGTERIPDPASEDARDNASEKWASARIVATPTSRQKRPGRHLASASCRRGLASASCGRGSLTANTITAKATKAGRTAIQKKLETVRAEHR
jgi:hypothetical protein